MTPRALSLPALVALTALAAPAAVAQPRDRRLAVSVWTPSDADDDDDGAPAFVVQERDVEIAADGVLRFAGVAASAVAGTAVLRLADATVSVVEQRLVGDGGDPDALLAGQLGKPVTVTLARGEVQGVLRAVSPTYLALETQGAAGRQVELVRRSEQVQAVRFAAADLATEPTFEWRLTGARPGKQAAEVSYHADGLRWTPSYTAVIDGDAVDFSAWATIANRSGLDLDGAELTLMTGQLGAARAFKLPRPITLAADHELQVELVPRRTTARAGRVTVFEAAHDRSDDFTDTPADECYGYAAGDGEVQATLEVDRGGGPALPPGPLRLLRRDGGRLVLDRIEARGLDGGSGPLRIGLGADAAILGERKAERCDPDATGRALTEEVTIELRNTGKAAATVVVRDYLFRWRSWRITREDVKGVEVGPQAREWRVELPAGGRRTLRYTVVYTW